MKHISLMGSTGSIGKQALEVAAANPDKLKIRVLVAHKSDEILEQQIRQFEPDFAVLTDKEAAARLAARYHGKTEILSGKRLIITASGVPFRGRKRHELENVTLEQCLKHPNWSMGRKVTLDSSTLANKGLEVIEAHWLFNMPYDKIDVVVHPQSIVHSLVEFCDGSVIAQLGEPDMRLPIQYALSWPERFDYSFDQLDLVRAGSLTFEAPDLEAFPSLKIAMDCGRAGGTLPCAFNAANEEAVNAFFDGKIKYLDIPYINAKTTELCVNDTEPQI